MRSDEQEPERHRHLPKRKGLDAPGHAVEWTSLLALLNALGLQKKPEAKPRRRRRAETSQSMAVSGEIGATDRPDLRARLAAPESRIDAALEACELQRDLPDVVRALDRFTPDELIAVIPALAELPGEMTPMLAEKLDWPHVAGISSLEVGDGTLTAQRPVEGAVEVLESSLEVPVDVPRGAALREALADRLPESVGGSAANETQD